MAVKIIWKSACMHIKPKLKDKQQIGKCYREWMWVCLKFDFPQSILVCLPLGRIGI